MAWQEDMVRMLRVLINDTESIPVFSTQRLLNILTVAASYVQNEIRFSTNYTILLPNTISPDPTLTNPVDRDFITFVVLKAACIMDKALLNTSSSLGSIYAKAGEVKFDRKSAAKNYKHIIQIGSCEKYEKRKRDYLIHNLDNALSVLSPFVDIVPDDFEPTVVPEQPEEPAVAGDFTIAVHPNMAIYERNILNLNNGSLGTITAEDARDRFSATVNWGDGTTNNVSIGYGVGVAYMSASHLYTADGIYIVTVNVSDDDGGSKASSFVVTVINVDLVGDFSLLAAANISVVEGEEFSGTIATLTYQDDQDTFTATVNWGDGNIETIPVNKNNGTAILSGTHTYASDGVYQISVNVIEDDGGSKTVSLSANVIPDSVPGDFTITLSDNLSISEDSLLDLTGGLLGVIEYQDLEDSFTATVDWGDGNTDPVSIVYDNGTAYMSASHTYDDPEFYLVTVTVVDADMGTKSDAFIVQVITTDIAGDFELTVTGNKDIDENTVLDLTSGGLGSFTYVYPTDTFTATVDWGDDTVESATLSYSGGTGTISGSHNYGNISYADNGLRVVTVTLTDDDGGSKYGSFLVTISNVDAPFDPLPYETQDFINIESYGAVREENITPILQFAVERTSHDGTVYIPMGKYYITDTIVLSNVGGSIYFAPGSLLIWAGDTSKPMFKVIGDAFIFDGMATLQGKVDTQNDSERCNTAISFEPFDTTRSSTIIKSLVLRDFNTGININSTVKLDCMINQLITESKIGTVCKINNSEQLRISQFVHEADSDVVFDVYGSSSLFLDIARIAGDGVFYKVPSSAANNIKPNAAFEMVYFNEGLNVKGCILEKAGAVSQIDFLGLVMPNVDSTFFEILDTCIFRLDWCNNIQSDIFLTNSSDASNRASITILNSLIHSNIADDITNIVDSSSNMPPLINMKDCVYLDSIIIPDYQG